MRSYLIALFTVLIPALAMAQSYPAKPVKIIVPAQPGGGLDLVGRTIAAEMTKALNQSFFVENSAGAGGTVAAMATARAAPDGYTLMVANSGTHATNPAVRKLQYDALKDFTPVALVGGTPMLLVVTPAVPAENLKGFVDYAKGNSAKLNYGTGGIGLLNHLALEQFRGAAGLPEAPFGHYRGIGPAIADMLGNQIQVLMPGLAAALPHIRAGKLKPLAITGTKRHALVPDVPTFDEAGYKGFEGVQWYGIVGPARMPADVTRRLNAEINKAITSAALQQRLAAEALEVMPMSAEEFGTFLAADIARWSALARERNIRLDD
jgi:tripartite-type tricarboxylate transporter receptor subunit TctC